MMVVGIDSYHDASQKGRSIGAFVASTNKACTRWFSRVCHQMPGQEMVDGLKVCLIAAIRKYHEVSVLYTYYLYRYLCQVIISINQLIEDI